MPVGRARTIVLNGAVGHLIDVQADVSPGIVGVSIVGRPDAALSEARDRCRMAVMNSDLDWPVTRRVTVLLSPADLVKRGTHCDLAIALSVLQAAGKLQSACLDGAVFLGELALDGGLRPVPGVLPMVLAAAARGTAAVYLPEPQADEASMVPGVSVFGLRSLAQVVAAVTGDPIPEAPPVAALSGARLLNWRGQARVEETDLADVIGMEEARFAVEVAAAGGHHLMLSGPKGSGKTTLAERIPGILPDLDPEESLELTCIRSLAGTLEPAGGLIRRPPYLAPHHDASKASLVGGGSGRVRPGEISQAHAGVLVLDEFPLFHADVIDALRQPLESGEITIARGEETATFPARGIVVLACNPCPCGNYAPVARDNLCNCSELRRREYRAKLSAPVTDRIDIIRHMQPFGGHQARDPLAFREDSATVRARVDAARRRQAERYAGRSWRLNAHAPGPALLAEWPLPAQSAALLDERVYTGRLSRRGATRVHRLSWTLADLAKLDRPGPEEVQTALQLRLGDPLSWAALQVVG